MRSTFFKNMKFAGYLLSCIFLKKKKTIFIVIAHWCSPHIRRALNIIIVLLTSNTEFRYETNQLKVLTLDIKKSIGFGNFSLNKQYCRLASSKPSGESNESIILWYVKVYCVTQIGAVFQRDNDIINCCADVVQLNTPTLGTHNDKPYTRFSSYKQ